MNIQNCFIAGNTKNHISEWEQLTSDSFILNTIAQGLSLAFSEGIPEKVLLNTNVLYKRPIFLIMRFVL